MELIEALHTARTAGRLLLEHAATAAELAGIEWQQERSRLEQSALAALLLAVLLGIALLQLSALALLLAWDTLFRLPVAAVLALAYAVAALAAWRRLQQLARQGDGRFGDSRRELRKTAEVVRKCL